MSLTSFVERPDVKKELSRRFPKPRYSMGAPILAPPQTTNYSQVGTAFDYLLRWYVHRLNPEAVTSGWVAQAAVDGPLSPLVDEVTIYADGGLEVKSQNPLHKKAKQILKSAKASCAQYLRSGKITDGLLGNVLLLAQMDAMVRPGYIVDEHFGKVDARDVADLKKLISVVDPQHFKAKRLCILNPTFGEGSRLVGGADADILIDGTLIDIKTTKSPYFNQRYYHQLIGYLVVSRIGGVDGAPSKAKIHNVAVYFSRHAQLASYRVKDMLDEPELVSFAEWFRRVASNK